MSLTKLIKENSTKKVFVFENGNKTGIGFFNGREFHSQLLVEGVIPKETIAAGYKNPPMPSHIKNTFLGDYTVIEVSVETFNSLFVKPFIQTA